MNICVYFLDSEITVVYKVVSRNSECLNNINAGTNLYCVTLLGQHIEFCDLYKTANSVNRPVWQRRPNANINQQRHVRYIYLSANVSMCFQNCHNAILKTHRYIGR